MQRGFSKASATCCHIGPHGSFIRPVRDGRSGSVTDPTFSCYLAGNFWNAAIASCKRGKIHSVPIASVTWCR